MGDYIYQQFSGVPLADQVSAPPLAPKSAGLIKKETNEH